MAAHSLRHAVDVEATSYSNPFMTLTAVNENVVEMKTDYMSGGNKEFGHFNPFICNEEPVAVKPGVTEALHKLPWPKLSNTNPFIETDEDICCSHGCVADSWSDGSCFHAPGQPIHNLPLKLHHATTPLAATAANLHTNPFSPAHRGSFTQSTPIPTCSGLHGLCCNSPKDTNYGHLPEQAHAQTLLLKGPFTKCKQPKSRAQQLHSTHHQLSSESEEDYDHRGTVPTLRPGQYHGTSPWKEFLHRFESCAEPNYWSEKTMAVQLNLCLVGAAGAVIHRNPRSAQWDYHRLVEEMETAYGLSSEHAAAVAIELRQRVRKVGEALHVLRDDIYGKVSVAYSNRTETEQDAIGVEIFTNAVGDTEIVQKLLEQRPSTLAQAYDIARCHETTKQAASYVTGIMHAGARSTTGWKPRGAMIREGAEVEGPETAAAPPAASWKPHPHNPQHTPRRWKGNKDLKWEEVRCHNCSGLGHMRRDCPSPKTISKAQDHTRPTAAEHPEPTVLHLKAHSQEMNIRLQVYQLVVCAVLDTGAGRSVLPLHHYETIHPDVRPPLQPSIIKTLLGVGPGEIPVLGEAHIPVQINNQQVSVHFLVADIACDEALLGHPFLTQVHASLILETIALCCLGKKCNISNHKAKLRCVQ